MLAWLLSSMLYSPAALANDQSTHVWTAQHGVDRLPEGALKDFVSDPAHTRALLHPGPFSAVQRSSPRLTVIADQGEGQVAL